MKPGLQIAESLKEHREVVIPARVFNTGPQRVRLDQDQIDTLIEKLSVRTAAPPESLVMDLTYDHKAKVLSRNAFGTVLTSSFIARGENKRLRLLEKVIASKRSIATKKLAAYLEYTIKQTENLIQAVNKKIREDLDLQDPVIKGDRGMGYRINPHYMVHKR